MKNLKFLNRQVVIFVFCVLCCKAAYSQLFVGGKNLLFFVEITPDSALIESYGNSSHRIITPGPVEELVKNNQSSDTCYSGNNYQLVKTKKGYVLIDQFNKKTANIPLEIASYKLRDHYRKCVYLDLKQTEFYQLRDSIADSVFFWNPTNPRILYLGNDTLELNVYKREVDLAFQEARESLPPMKPFVQQYYTVANSINETDSVELFSLLDSANYHLNYGKYLVFRLSQENPSLLVHYLNQKPENERSILRGIRYYQHAEQIHDSVKTVKEKSAGRRKILRQKAISQVEMIGGITLYSVAFLAEITGIVLFFAWIF